MYCRVEPIDMSRTLLQVIISTLSILSSSACHYKVWYMESCVERVQVVHLLLARGGSDDCEIAKHLSRDPIQ